MYATKATNQRVVVVGAGVVGLSCAVQLAEAGYDTNVLARELPQETSSASGHGMWLPWGVELGTAEQSWAQDTLLEYERLIASPSRDDKPRAASHGKPRAASHDGPNAANGDNASSDGEEHGITARAGVVLDQHHSPATAQRLESVAAERDIASVANPAPGFDHGWHLTVPLVDPKLYLAYLQRRLIKADGTLTRMPVPQLPSRGITVNATGVASRALAQDASTDGMRLQIVETTNPGIRRWLTDTGTADGHRISVVPHSDRVIVGGILRNGDWGTLAEARASELIMDKAIKVVPELARADVIRDRVGIVPMRPSTRVATQRIGQAQIVHCYGHRELGFTTAWGSATEVVAQVERLLNKTQT